MRSKNQVPPDETADDGNVPLRVLFVIPTLHGGGAERVVVTILRHLDRNRFRPTLVVVDLHGEVYANELPDDVSVVDLGTRRVRYALPKLVSMIRRQEPAVVFSTLSHLNLALALVKPFLCSRTRLITRESSIVSNVLKDRKRSFAHALLYRWIYPRVDLLISQSQAMLDDLVDNFGFPRRKAVIIHNPVDLDRISRLAAGPPDPGFDPASVNLVAAGRLVAVKGFDVLLQSLALCGRQELTLTVLGEGPLRSQLESLAVRLGIAKRVRFVGFQSNPYPYYARADWFVVSSRYEGFPNAGLEALACTTPVVAVPAPGGIREMLAGISQARLAPGMDAAALAQCLAELPRHAQRVPKHLVQRYAAERVVAQFEAAFL
jgi:glycosyltransferase involved in cell wall biosynthesis